MNAANQKSPNLINKLLSLSFVLVFVAGCSSSTVLLPAENEPTADPTLEALFDEVENPKVYERLDDETLASIPDDELEQTITNYTWSKVTEAADIHQALLNSPDGLAAFYYIDELEGEVDNGGYNQYFYNTNGDHVEQTIWALNLLDFSELTENYEKAVAIWNNEKNDPRLQSLYESGTLEDFSETYKYTDLSVCDDEFYALDTKLRAAKVTFVRASPELFVDD